MISKDQFLAALEHEFMTIRHLASKIKDEHLAYRPTPGQRSLLEVLQYVSFVNSTMVEAVVTGNGSLYMERQKASESLALADFDAAMDKQAKDIRALITPLSDEQLAEEVEIWVKQTRAMHFLNGPLKWATAYKMQIFLYLKALGLSELNTSNLWAGMDSQPRSED